MPPQFNLFHPRYWPTWFGLSILYLVVQFPYRFQLWFGKILGKIAYYLLGRFRRIARTNLALCFPELKKKTRQRLLKKHFEDLGMGLVESAMAWWMPGRRLNNLLQIQGLQYLSEALEKKRGVIILSGHFTPLDICGRLFSNIFPMSVVYREQKNQVIDLFLKRHRNFKLMQPIHRHAIRQIIKSLKQNKAIWYAADQDYGAAHSVFAPFFGIEAATITTPSRYAKQTYAEAVTLFYHRLPNGKGYQIIIRPIDNFHTIEPAAAAEFFNKSLEKAIQAHPEQYLWIHRRFKTRPSGKASFY